jgi:hypothetical protein
LPGEVKRLFRGVGFAELPARQALPAAQVAQAMKEVPGKFFIEFHAQNKGLWFFEQQNTVKPYGADRQGDDLCLALSSRAFNIQMQDMFVGFKGVKKEMPAVADNLRGENAGPFSGKISDMAPDRPAQPGTVPAQAQIERACKFSGKSLKYSSLPVHI